MSTTIITTEKLVKRFPVGEGEFTALNNVNLTFEEGEFSGIIGPSGSGKTTLLNILGSLDSPTEGTAFALVLQHRPAAERKKAVMEALEWVGLAHMAHKRPSKLSGGEGQRVAIARAMVKRPELVLADEPTANLDATNAHAILQTMKKLNEELKTTFLFATHDEKVMSYLNRLIRLEDGKVTQDENITAKTLSP
ncbi:MAG: lipoprotein-releasing system ATP-binding protein LolD [Bacteroidetes bacterium]|nr:MAG: lipoprotein-releasing system ATP-binding protein LolD [Bacteroidota bacterium]